MKEFTTIFDDIRPYGDAEVQPALKRLLSTKAFQEVLQYLFPDATAEMLENELNKVSTVRDFQQQIVSKAVHTIIKNSTQGASITGLENIDPGLAYLFVSNHRDIVLDAAIFNYLLFLHQFETTRIAIGDNLLHQSWVADLARLNKNFIVKRSLSMREQVIASMQLSAFIRNSITVEKESVWIAQRDGRTKDGNDLTSPGLIKMFAKSAPNLAIEESLSSLNLVPMAIAYEWEPCAWRKAKELYLKQLNADYKKPPGEDLASMEEGIISPKGRVHIHIAKPLSQNIQRMASAMPESELYANIASTIDKSIYKGYKLFPANYVAAHLLSGSDVYIEYFNKEDWESFHDYLHRPPAYAASLAEALKPFLISIYAGPVLNQEAFLKDAN